jgi:hypothetical protein
MRLSIALRPRNASLLSDVSDVPVGWRGEALRLPYFNPKSGYRKTTTPRGRRDGTASILKTLSPKEEKVIRLRLGIGCENEHTLEEISQEFDLTRERIRQIEAEALGHLRAPERARRLRALMAAR